MAIFPCSERKIELICIVASYCYRDLLHLVKHCTIQMSDNTEFSFLPKCLHCAVYCLFQIFRRLLLFIGIFCQGWISKMCKIVKVSKHFDKVGPLLGRFREKARLKEYFSIISPLTGRYFCGKYF